MIFDMSIERCNAVFAFAVTQEGSKFENDSRDPGGATKYGITLTTLREYYGNYSLGTTDVASLTYSVAQTIFRKSYWNPCRGDELPLGIDSSVVDEAYNAGVNRAIKFLQTTVGTTPDGNFGPITMAAILKISPVIFVNNYAKICIDFYKSLGNKTYENGWLNRVEARKIFSLSTIQKKVSK